MTDPSPSFWKRSASRFGRSKSIAGSKDEDLRSARERGAGEGQVAFTFVEDENLGKNQNTKAGSGRSDSEKTPKERRRAQVRKAQIEHRQRKENHGKHLEQQIIVLRERIAQAETQAVLFKHENIAIRTTLQSNFIPLPLNFASQPFPNPVLNTNTAVDLDIDMDLSNYISPTSLFWTQNTTLVRTAFDPFLDEECLQISPAGSFPLSVDSNASFGMYAPPGLNVMDTSISLPSPDIFNSKNWKPAVLAQQERDKSYRQQRGNGAGGRGGLSGGAGGAEVGMQPLEEEMEMLAINFILALEHPCRKHFSPPSTDPFDPEARPSGHELMATTHLFSHASSFTLPLPHQNLHPHPHPHNPSQSTSNPPFPLHNNLTPTPLTTTITPHLPPNPIRKPSTITSKILHRSPPVSIPMPPLSPTFHPTIGASPGSTWLIPPPTLQNLYAMSESMAKEDWEITPVQAWFLLEERYGWERLLSRTEVGVTAKSNVDVETRGLKRGGEEGREGEREGVLDALKRGLATLVTCQDFGSVIDENGFWAVVRSVLGEDRGGEWV